MKREIKIVPLILSILGFVAVGLCLGSLYEVATTFELWFGVVFGFIAFTFILLLSIGFPLSKEEREHTEIKW
jgi:predicted tellurium resistance membrane protein TerC